MAGSSREARAAPACSHRAATSARRSRSTAALRRRPRMNTLAIDASTYTGDVAVIDGTRVLAEANTAMRGADEERLMPTVARTLFAANVGVNEIDRVVCGAGPGSFTSLRIAGAIAKGIATGVGRPLYAVSSMALIV